MLEELGPGIGTVAAPLRVAGAAMGTRMTVVRVGEEGVVLIAPCPIDDALASEIEAWGPVRALIAPNCFHHFYLKAAAERFPEAALYLAEGVESKLAAPLPRPAEILGDVPAPLWKADLEQLRIEGAPRVNEVVFFHAASRTLILTDLCFHFDPAPGGWTGLFLRLAGAHGRLAVSRLMRSMLKDRVAVRRGVERILAWDFDRIVVTHGEPVRDDGQRLLREATADL